MLPINLSQNLDKSAFRMIQYVVEDAPAKRIYINKFFKDANTNNLQGYAIVSYHSALSNFKKRESGFASMDKMQRIENVQELIEQEVKQVPELKKQTNKFLKALDDAYGDKDLFDKSGNLVKKNGKKGTLLTRILLARDGAVVSNRVRPRSSFTHNVVDFERFCINTIDKVKTSDKFQNIAKFLKRVVKG